MILDCKRVSKKYEEKLVLSSISLCLKKGEILSVIGPSGSGKTTLVRILATLEKPDTGEVRLLEKVIKSENDLYAVRKNIGYVQQKPVLLTGTVYDNIAIPLLIRNFEKEEIKKKVFDVAKMLGITDILNKNVRKISGGEAQRVAFARAVIGEPQILFLDEFTANLDYKNVALLEQQVREFVKRGGSVLMVSHNLLQVRRLANRVAILIDGKIEEQGDTKKVIENPETELAKQFVSGEMPW
ncbi:MAG: ABC transporter ATP-binding protein [Thermoplasmata archaeon]